MRYVTNLRANATRAATPDLDTIYLTFYSTLLIPFLLNFRILLLLFIYIVAYLLLYLSNLFLFNMYCLLLTPLNYL